MLDSGVYRNIYNLVKGDVLQVECDLMCSVPESCPFYEDLRGFLMAPSKRIRSVLTFLYLRSCGLEVKDEIIKLLSIVELIHNASLIHDDIIDGDDVRRNQKTLNSIFGSKISVVFGDFLLSIVMNKLTKLDNIQLFSIFSDTIQNMCEGEILQYSNLFKMPSIDDYIEKSYKKTASLFEAAIKGASLLSTDRNLLSGTQFARNFGIAFQIRDDLNNVLNNGKDIAEGIYNAPVILSGDKVVADEGLEKTKILLNNYLENARKDISNIADNEYKLKILELLELFHG